jgi:hypothetical protein
MISYNDYWYYNIVILAKLTMAKFISVKLMMNKFILNMKLNLKWVY